MISPRLILLLGVLLQTSPLVAAPETPSAKTDEKAAAAAQTRAELAELRKQIGELSRRMAELSLELGDVGPQGYAFRYLNDQDRAMVGVVLSSEPKGARIDAVTPDGPAARAGIHSGDLLVSINGESLVLGTGGDPVKKAGDMLGKLKPGEAVRLGYRRGARDTTVVEVKAERREAWNWQTLFAADADLEAAIDKDHQRDIERRIEVIMSRQGSEAEREAAVDARKSLLQSRSLAWRSSHDGAGEGADPVPMHFEMMHESMPWWGINLASLNADLGHYFGTDSGVLVLSASEEALPDIKAGDVIRRIADTPVARPEQALRTLRDQDAGQLVKLDILRDRKPMTLTIRAPKYKALFSVGAPPAPPAPPKPPKAPAPVKPVSPPPPSPPPAPPVPPTPPDPPTSPEDAAIF
ncbi:PDZ domain-containing protein [Dokdonella sp.]|uniref:PDZ domain-containing protein n=1 Tax=Dokdonella sp. TaxID=2291710 RepID=UPI0035290AE2